ncbi:hypothetical protein [Planococcus dechangensis]|uniref:DUF1259 domain-containing protein n=1 Tax=Planococcus dechangensis TaxID=1176255 RepID=A0ABV9MD02_9BACL
MNEELRIAEEMQRVLNATFEFREGKFHFNKTKQLEIFLGTSRFLFKLDCEISFEHLQQDGAAINKATMYLLPEEVLAFVEALRKFPFPIAFRQRFYLNPHIVELSIESLEPPKAFAQRLSAALSEID